MELVRVATVIKVLVQLTSINCLALIRHIEFNGSHLVELDSANYAITGPILRGTGWASLVSKASMGYSYDTNCEMQQLYNLTELDIIRDKLGKLEVDKLGPEDRYGYTGFEEGNAAAVESSGTLCYTFLHYDKFEMQKRDASHYSFIRPDSYDRVFVLYDTVTFVSLKKGVDMKPIRCLSAQEAKYVHETSGYARGSIFYPRVTLETIV